MAGERYIVDINGNKMESRGTLDSKKLLRPELRELPGEFVTSEIADSGKIHELDAPHIVDAIATELIEDIVEADNPTSKPKKIDCAQPGQVLRFTSISPEKAQFEIDIIRLRVMKTLVDRFVKQAASGLEPDIKVRHLWFPKDNVNEYALRMGNPPRDVDRPPWLRGRRIEIDVEVLPDTVAAILEAEDDDERDTVLNRMGAR